VAAIAELAPGLASATEKKPLLPLSGSVVADGRTLSLDQGTGAYDYTHGLLERRTRWRWAFGMGQLGGGDPVAFNVVNGFVGEAECAAFSASEVHPLGEPKISFEPGRPDGTWRLVGDGVDLTFEPGAVYAQRTNLLVVRSRFLQPAGLFRGTLRLGDREHALDGVPGVVEDQDVVW
jgi:hypothetical protein